MPLTPPGWVKAVKAVAEIDAKGDPMVAEVLGSINESMARGRSAPRGASRRDQGPPSALLKAMLASWRNAVQLLGQVDGKVTRLLQRTQIVDRHIAEYEEIIRQTDRAERMLSSSSLVQFFVSLFVLVIAIGGAVINFNLIARPMAEMVGGTNFIGSWQVADIAALVIILVEVSMGLFLMEIAAHHTAVPGDRRAAGQVAGDHGLDHARPLTALASVEAGLAYMREVLLHDELATSALLRGDAEGAYGNEFLWITTAAQMGMGFILPFALTFVAIPLETFVHSLRTVLGVGAVGPARSGRRPAPPGRAAAISAASGRRLRHRDLPAALARAPAQGACVPVRRLPPRRARSCPPTALT